MFGYQLLEGLFNGRLVSLRVLTAIIDRKEVSVIKMDGEYGQVWDKYV